MALRYPIQDSVGRGGRNFFADVVTVKTMLNAKMPIPLLPLYVNGTCDWQTIQSIEAYQQRNLRMAYPSGRIDPGDATHLSLNLRDVSAQPKPSTGTKYSNSPNEVVIQPTRVTRREVVDMVLTIWPDIYPPGARTLTAQWMAETGGGPYCYNWNLGNEKSPGTDKRHIYHLLIWECYSQSDADAQVAKGNGLAWIASADEIKKYGTKYGWRCKNVMVLFKAPHNQCRFFAYSSLREGAEHWVDRHQQTARRIPDYLKILQSGDAAGAAKALRQDGYYTADPTTYAKAMVDQRWVLDRELGPLPPPWK
jgi:hypothetical protein